MRRSLVRNVATVAAGAAVAQAVTMAFFPLLTRLYTPEAFGLQSLFASLLGLCTVLAAMGYPTAIVLPRKQQDAIALARLTITTATGMAILFTVILYFTADQLLAIFNAQALGALVYLLPFAMLSSTLSAVLAQWLIREHAYGITARFEVATALLLGTAKSSMGAIAPSASALILVNILGGLTGTLLTFWGWLKSPAKEQRLKNAQKSIDPETRKGMAALAREYRDFPLYRTPQNFINMASQSLPIIMLAAYFGPSASGQYSIAISLLGIPTALIGGAVVCAQSRECAPDDYQGYSWHGFNWLYSL